MDGAQRQALQGVTPESHARVRFVHNFPHRNTAHVGTHIETEVIEMAKNPTAPSQADETLVLAYGVIAGESSKARYEFALKECKGKSVAVIADSIKAGQKKYGTVSAISADSARSFATLAVFVEKFADLPETVEFSKAVRVAVKADRELGTNGARDAVRKADTFAKFADSLPKQARSPKGSKSGEGTALTPDTFYQVLVEMGEALEGEALAKFIKNLTNLTTYFNTVMADRATATATAPKAKKTA